MGKLIGGITLLGVALFMLLGYAGLDRSLEPAVAIMTLLLTVGLPGAGGLALVYSWSRERGSFARRRERLVLETHQAEILKLATAKAGKVTVLEVVGDTGIGVESAEAALRDLVERSIAEVEVSETGMLVYRIPDIQKLPEKGTSKGVLDD